MKTARWGVEEFDPGGLGLHVFSISCILPGLSASRRLHNRDPLRKVRGATRRPTMVGDKVMRTGASDIPGRGHRGRIRPDARLKRARKSRIRRIDLEGLEARTLLATIPAAQATGAPIALTGLTDVTTQGNADSPTVAIDPTNPNKLVAVWVVNNPSIPAPSPTVNVQGAFSTDAGQTWLSFSAEGVLPDPNTTNPTVPY